MAGTLRTDTETRGQTLMPFPTDGFTLPTYDFQAAAMLHRKNLESLAGIGQIALSGVQTLWQRQSDMVGKALQATIETLPTLVSDDPPADHLARQFDLAKGLYERTAASAKVIGGVVAETQSQAAAVLSARVLAGLEEAKSVFAAAAGKA
jgi:phasin family protein